MNKELAKTLTTAIVQFIDKERPEGTMDCSNVECESIEQMLEGEHFDIVEAFIQKKLSALTEFEKCMLDYALARDEYKYDSTKVVELNNKVIELTKSYAKTLLELAKKQLLSYADESNPAIEAMADLERTLECNPEKLPKWLKEALDERYQEGYWKGRKEGLEEYNKSVVYHYDTRPLCWEPGGTCTNPQMDCVNCPKKTTGGGFNTSSGTSVTDGKPHNPSFTD